MRLISALVLALGTMFVAACGDDSSSTEMDLSVSGGSCLSIVTCVQTKCTDNSPTCANMCAASASPAATTKYQALIGCAYGQCTVAHDGGAAACSSSTDTSATCSACLVTGAQAAACSTQLNACLSG